MSNVTSRLAAALFASLLAVPGLAAAAEVNVYSYRQEVLIRPLLDAFTKDTGIKVNLVSDKEDSLLQRLESEGRNSPADVLMTVDAGRLLRAREAGVLQPVKSQALESAIPASLRDPDGYWFGLSQRSRVVFYAKDRVDPKQLSSYLDLADPKWKGRICVRSSSSVYNQSMLAAMIAHHGAEKAEAWAKGIVDNMARKPQGGDRDQIKAAAAGECDVAIANTYYYAGLQESKQEADRAAAAKVALFWPSQDGHGAHMNVSGAGVTANAPNKESAIRFLEFLVTDEAQRIYAEQVNEFPVKPGIDAAETIAAFGAFKPDSLQLAELAKHNAEAMRIFDRVGWR